MPPACTKLFRDASMMWWYRNFNGVLRETPVRDEDWPAGMPSDTSEAVKAAYAELRGDTGEMVARPGVIEEQEVMLRGAGGMDATKLDALWEKVLKEDPPTEGTAHPSSDAQQLTDDIRGTEGTGNKPA